MLLARGSADVVVVAGLPGAGKTTLVAAEPRALDSDALRLAWAPRLRRLPYAVWRPLVHARHWIAIWRALKRPEGVIVVRPFTAGWLRRAVLRRARRHHPAVHLVVVNATPAEARAGQRARGRTIGARAMRRHARRWARADLGREPWTTVTRVARAQEAPTRAASAWASGRAPAPSPATNASIAPSRSANEVAQAAASVPSRAARPTVAASRPKRSRIAGSIGLLE